MIFCAICNNTGEMRTLKRIDGKFQMINEPCSCMKSETETK